MRSADDVYARTLAMIRALSLGRTLPRTPKMYEGRAAEVKAPVLVFVEPFRYSTAIGADIARLRDLSEADAALARAMDEA